MSLWLHSTGASFFSQICIVLWIFFHMMEFLAESPEISHLPRELLSRGPLCITASPTLAWLHMASGPRRRWHRGISRCLTPFLTGAAGPWAGRLTASAPGFLTSKVLDMGRNQNPKVQD